MFPFLFHILNEEKYYKSQLQLLKTGMNDKKMKCFPF